MKRDYKIVGKFDCNGEHLLIVRINRNVHMMTVEELNRWYGRLHSERWKRSA